MAQERLQKILAAAGIASRRKAEEFITAGRVSVNGERITELGSKADPRLDEIRVDGQLLRGRERHVYLALYKPKGYVTTVSDPEGRPTVMDLLHGVEQRVFPVGRLDYASEGLLLTRAAARVPKTYMVKVSGVPAEEQIDQLRSGIYLPSERSRAGTMGGMRPGMARRSGAVRTQPAGIELVREQENPWYRVTLTEGRNRQIRRMFEQIGHHVEKIKRVRYGPLELDLEPGKWRFLKPREVAALRSAPTKTTPAFAGSPTRPGHMRGRPVDGRNAGGQRPFGKARGRGERGPSRQPADKGTGGKRR
jgi:23S rRNA pseudouridine2605 synthase